MAFWDDAKKKMQNMVKPRQEEQPSVLSNRADGGFSGYQPKMVKRPDNAAQQTGYQPTGFQRPVQGAAPSGFEGMMPTGVDPSVMQQFQPVGGQTGQMPPQQQTPQQGMPQQQPRPQAAFQPQPGYQPQPYQQSAPQQPQRPAFGQPPMQSVQQPPMQAQPAFQRGFTMPQQPVQQAPQQENNTFFFPGDYQVDGNSYKLVFRVAQITGVPSCFRVIEFMYNNEAVIVNAEQITDLVEADRCMDLIFGAACAMKQRLMRVSGKQIYLITPPQVYVAPFENLRRAGMEDIDRRWPGALQMNMQPVGTVQPQRGFGAAPQQQNDFAGGFGRRASRGSARPGDYTDYGGFGMKTR